jgi:hypothetical protein
MQQLPENVQGEARRGTLALTEAEWIASATQGTVPSVRDDGMRVLALDILKGVRPICNDWVPELLRRQIVDDNQQDDIDIVLAAVEDGVLCCDRDELDPPNRGQYITGWFDHYITAEYFLPAERWRRENIVKARQITTRSKHIVLGLLRDYSIDNINAYILRNFDNPYKSAIIGWDKARDWACRQGIEERLKWPNQVKCREAKSLESQ